MKSFTIGICLFFITIFAHAQNGLESIIVEKYYIADANDTMVNADGGILPVGSVTYRVYADMLPGYKFQAAYGINNPVHELRIATTTLFFNNEDRGATSPTYTKLQASHNTVMLDSWLSSGAACAGNFGILKINDDGVATVVNTDGVLQNTDSVAGIPVMTEDGLIAGTPEPVTAVGITTEMTIFDNQNDGTNGPLFFTDNGSWASLNGSYGPDSLDNKVLIAQITTDGIFSFELNIQIGTPSGGVENYVALNPSGNEIQIPSLIYNSLAALVAGIDAPVSSFNVYPNPAKDQATMDIDISRPCKSSSYTIYDMKGSVVEHRNIGSIPGKYQQQLNLNGLGKGQYFIELQLDGALSTKKIVIN